MTTLDMPRPVELIPPQPQALWGKPAVANFALGGVGAGLYLAAALASRFGASPGLALASWLGPALVLAGFVAVATEAGRPLRGIRVLRRVRTSWMSRELWIGSAFAALALVEFVAPGPAPRLAAAVAAVALAAAQGAILRHARGVAAWDVALMPGVFLASAAVSGTGLHAVIEVASARTPAPVLAGAMLLLLILGALVWLAYLTGSRDGAFRDASRALREGPMAVAILGTAYLAPFLATTLALALPPLAGPALAVAGALMIAGQVQTKAALILAAGHLRPITLASLRLRSEIARRRSS